MNLTHREYIKIMITNRYNVPTGVAYEMAEAILSYLNPDDGTIEVILHDAKRSNPDE